MDEQLEHIQKELKKELDAERYEHTISVMYTAACLAMCHNCDMKKAMLAGLLHDCAKCIPHDKKIKMCKKHKVEMSSAELENPSLLHAKLGAIVANETYRVEDADIIHAIAVHTTGAPAMSLLDKIVFVADFIEPNRYKVHDLAQIRELSFTNLDLAVARITGETLKFLQRTKKTQDIDPMTLQTYEYYQEGDLT